MPEPWEEAGLNVADIIKSVVEHNNKIFQEYWNSEYGLRSCTVKVVKLHVECCTVLKL